MAHVSIVAKKTCSAEDAKDICRMKELGILETVTTALDVLKKWGGNRMSVILQAIRAKICANCTHMPKGYHCDKLKKTFDGHEIDKGLVPCKGKHFEHYMSKKGLTIHIVDRDGNIIGTKEYRGE